MTLFIGMSRIEQNSYSGVASRTSNRCNMDIKMKGIQVRKSVVIINVIFLCSRFIEFFCASVAPDVLKLDDAYLKMKM